MRNAQAMGHQRYAIIRVVIFHFEDHGIIVFVVFHRTRCGVREMGVDPKGARQIFDGGIAVIPTKKTNVCVNVSNFQRRSF